MIFSSAWNVQTKVALESLRRSQLGIRFHNGFIHWRQAGDEVSWHDIAHNYSNIPFRLAAQCYISSLRSWTSGYLCWTVDPS
jgi:hypothetical protein